MSDPKVFSLAGQNLKLDTRADIQPHLDTLSAIPDLEEIHLGGNTLGVEACQALAEVLKSKKTLKVANFADIFTGRLITEIPDALRALCDALQNNESLVELNLSDNAFGGRSAEPMVNFLKHNHNFSVLKLNNNGLGVTGGTIVAEALIAAAHELSAKGLQSKLRTVICGRNRLENGSAPVWAKAFAAHAGLVEVRMFQNGIRMEGIQAISQGLSACPNLEVLDLQDYTATLRGSRAIAACLPRWPALKTLNLSDCLLKPKGGALVFGALANGTNPQLETIQVQYCDLDRNALDTLGTAIGKHLKQLAKLEINGNWADEDDDCITKIKDALAKWDHADALDELDEMDPEGEEDEDEAEDEDEEEPPAPNPYINAEVATAGAATSAGAAATAASITQDDASGLAKPVEKIKVSEDPATSVSPVVNSAEPTVVAVAAPQQEVAPAALEPTVEGAAPAIDVSSTEAPASANVETAAKDAPASVADATAAPAPAAADAPAATKELAPEEKDKALIANAQPSAAAQSTVDGSASQTAPAGATLAKESKKPKKKGGIKGLIASIKQKLA